MNSTASRLPWLQAVVTHPVHATGTPATTGGRHRAPEVPGAVEYLTSEQIAGGAGLTAGSGRHAEPDWSREVFDPARDEVDAFDWLGFEAAQD